MKRVLLGFLLAFVFPASGVEVSRSKVDHPPIGTSGGASLHSQIEAIYEILGDNANSRYSEFSAIADSATVEVDHNFGVSLTELNVLIYSGSGAALTRIPDPELQSPPWTIQEKTGSEKTIIEIIAPSSGGPHTFAVVTIHGKGAEKLTDLSDVDLLTAPPEDGQALVYSSTGTEWVAGASGDASFKIQSVTDPNAVIKGGGINVDRGRQLATYDGAGSQAVDFKKDLTCDLDAILGSSPVNDTTYVLYIDLVSVGNTPTTTSDSGEELYPVECADLVLLTDFPDGNVIASRYVHLGNIHSADTGTVWSGTGASFNTFFFRSHGKPIVNTSPVIYSLGEQAVGAVGSASQIVAGHGLQGDSFGFTPSDDLAYWNFTADGNDDSGATSCTGGTVDCNLTNNGSIAFGDPDLFGSAGVATFDGTAKYFNSSNAFFNPGNVDFSGGGWVYIDWTTGAQAWMTNTVSGADRGFIFWNQGATNQINLQLTNTAGGYDLTLNHTHSFATEWVHVAFTYDAGTPGTVRLYVNGIEVTSGSVQQRATTGNDFQISGQQGAVADHINGRLQEFFFTTKTLTAEEIRKLASYRIDHNQNVAVGDQNWIANFDGSLANQLDNGWIVDKSANSVWFDFLDLSSTDKVSLKLKNENATAHVIPIKTYDSGFLSSAPSFPLSHSLGSVPAQVVVLHEGQTTAGDFDNVSSLCSWDDTQITCSGLNTVDGTHRLRIVMSVSTVAVSIDEATATQSGIVTSSAQTFGGNKTFNNDVNIGGNLSLQNGGTSINHYQEQTLSTAWTNASGTMTGHATRIGNVVTILIDSFGTVTASGVQPIFAASALATDLRPASNVSFLYRGSFNGGAITHQVARVTAAGSIAIYRSIDADDFGAADTMEVFEAIAVSYVVD